MMDRQKAIQGEIPATLWAGFGVVGGYMLFVAMDQAHWWLLKPDYAFGWLVPFFAGYVIYERWDLLREILRTTERTTKEGVSISSVVAGLCFAVGLLAFLFGALYRAGQGVSQPGSLALAFGFACVFPAIVFFAVPAGTVPGINSRFGLLKDARLRAVSLFLFPSAIWLLSAPLLSAVENGASLFLLRKVVAVVFGVFNLLGLPLVREGNVLLLPTGQVGVADACSGIRSLMGCLFAGSFLAAVYLDRIWKKVLLVSAALIFAFATNLLRSLFLTAWAYRYGSVSIEGEVHDATGYAVLGLTSLGLFCLLPLFRCSNWSRWLGIESPRQTN